jgi:hypothetical protein
MNKCAGAAALMALAFMVTACGDGGYGGASPTAPEVAAPPPAAAPAADAIVIDVAGSYHCSIHPGMVGVLSR